MTLKEAGRPGEVPSNTEPLISDAGVIDLDRVGGGRPLAEAALQDLDLKAIGLDDHTRFFGIGGEIGGIGLGAQRRIGGRRRGCC